MSCDCEIYECLPIAPLILQCGSGITTLLDPGATGTWTVHYEFNGGWKGFEIEVTLGEAIVLPNVFNEVYTHKIKIYDGSGDLVNDTCYELKMSSIAYANGGTSGTTDDALRVYSFTATEDLQEFEVPAGYQVWLIAPGNQAFARNVDFDQEGNDIELINGSIIPATTQVTIFYKYIPV